VEESARPIFGLSLRLNRRPTFFSPDLFAALDRPKEAFEKAGCANSPREPARGAGCRFDRGASFLPVGQFDQ
jgi:hypothetical protein